MTTQAFYEVHKFGGSSLANAEKFRAVQSLLTGQQEIVVVSAIQGTTSALQHVLDNAKSKRDYLPDLHALEETHLMLLRELLPGKPADELISVIQQDVGKIHDILCAIQLTHSYSPDMQNLVLGYGELWSAMILTAFLGQHHQVMFLDAANVLFVYEKEGMVGIDWDKSRESLDNYLNDVSFDQLVITGFIASGIDGQRTTLGRNGSDFSAAIFANLFHARSLTIWTDVDGVYTADPNLVRSAFVINSLSYLEALELAYFGAKVLHPMTIAPLVVQQIPMYIKNSFNPAAKGTLISAASEPSFLPVKGITCVDAVTLITIEGSGLISVSGIASRVADTLYRSQINVLFIAQASSEHSLCLAIPSLFSGKAINALRDRLHSDIERRHIAGIQADADCAILSAVGDEMVGTIGIAGKLCTALARANVNIRAISQGSSERNISVLIRRADINKAMQAVHSGFYLSRKTLSIGLIGPGSVGKSLLRQLAQAVEQIRATCDVDLNVRGIMSSQSMLLSESALDLHDWQNPVDGTLLAADLADFVRHIAADSIPHALIIDCTANQEIASQYLSFMEKGIHIITPNKHANAGDLASYRRLKERRKWNTHYFYEATVCAGLPVISTLQDLIKTGDDIEEIEGVVSGTLSYIFNEMAKGRSFSDVVIDAKERGYTEPDPREDLSGMDVARKLVCLARELGHDVTLNDVAVYDLVPSELKSGSSEGFIANLANYDHKMDDWVAAAKASNQRLHYVGSISCEGKLQVNLKLLPGDHPFARLEGTDNMLIFRTRRYHERPLVIQGPGAGAEVTAAGIFADLLRLASVLS